MTKIDPLTSTGYAYVQIADILAARIRVGQYASKLPSERDLAAEFGVSYQTLRHAMAVLRERGLIITRQGWGTFIRDQR